MLPREIQEAFTFCSGKKELADLVHTFQFILAHELVHVFDALKYLVSAFKNWRAFWKNVLNEGYSIDAMYEKLSDKTIFLDNYGRNNELESIRDYWPSRAGVWFQTRKLDSSSIIPSFTATAPISIILRPLSTDNPVVSRSNTIHLDISGLEYSFSTCRSFCF